MFFVCLVGFLLGLTIPAIASRFGKILPADPGLVCASLWHKPHFPKTKNAFRLNQLKSKWRKLAFFSFGWGLVLAILFGLVYVNIPQYLVFGALFFYISGLLIAVDHQYFLLPDFFTIPLLLLGFTFIFFAPQTPVSLIERVVGAWYGYALSTFSVFIMSFFKKAEFGAGDVKMLTALGAWFGVLGLSVTLVISFLFFSVTALIKHQRAGAFGPALGFAGIVMFFLIYMNLLWTF